MTDVGGKADTAAVASRGIRPRLGEPAGRGVRVQASGLTRSVPAGLLLEDVSLTIEPNEVVAIVGGSGAGKTTLLEALAAVRPADEGTVWFDGVDVYQNLDALPPLLGFVPQEDIIHTELALERTLRYAARLRLPPRVSREEIDAAVATALGALDLEERRAVRVGALSGGQRKRASIAVELLTNPRVFFLDEPTSGLDPATAAELLKVLRKLAEGGTTVILTTHSPLDLKRCDRIAFLARGGRLAFVGTEEEAFRRFGVASVEEVYARLADVGGNVPVASTEAQAELPRVAAGSSNGEVEERLQPGWFRQLGVLTQRTAETLLRNRLTMAILLGSPAAVVLMFAILFRPGAFNVDNPSPSAILMIVFWIAFAAFFFGLTYGLLQVVTERPIVAREHLVGLRLGAYVMSKLLVLLPFLLVVVVLMLGVLRALGRLPAVDLTTYLSVGVTLMLEAAGGLTLGLLASAAVRNASQATLALPLLCFPAVLFSGAILPVHIMAGVGAAISVAMPVRWAFEAIGHDLGVRQLLLGGGSPLGPPLVASYGDAGSHATGTYWAILLAFSLVFLVGAGLTLRSTVRRSTR